MNRRMLGALLVAGPALAQEAAPTGTAVNWLVYTGDTFGHDELDQF